MTAETDLSTAMNYRYYLERLADPSLLDAALVTSSNDLAVPVGGRSNPDQPGCTRRGGWVSVVSRAEGRQLIGRMREQPALFPDPRFAYGGQCVAFGDEEPDDDEAAGRYFGYSETAIRAFMERIHALTE